MSTRDEVLAAAAVCVEAFGAHDAQRYFACFDTAATFLFHSTDRLLDSRQAYETEWQAWEADGFRVLGCVSTDQRVDVWDDPTRGSLAVFTHRVQTRLRLAGPDSPVTTQHERETIVFHRGLDGRWLGVHEHLSVDPLD